MAKRAILIAVTAFLFFGSSAAWCETPISSLPYYIGSPGSYYLTGDLTMPGPGKGIEIGVNNVTIDFRGHTITGTRSSVDRGISAYGFSNIEVRNGTITNFYAGIYIAEGSDRGIRIINMRVGNNAVGMYLINHSNLVKDCLIYNNVAEGSGASGIYATGNSSIIQGNEVYGNSGTGIVVLKASLVTGNISHDHPGGAGIYAAEGSTVSGNVVYNNSTGMSVGVGSTVTGNTAYYNKNTGIGLGGNSFVDGNTAYSNDQLHLGNPNMTPCATCTFGINHAP